MTDTLNFLLGHQLGNALKQCLFVDLVGQLINDDGLALAFVDIFEVALRAHDHAATARAVAIFDA